MWTKTETAVDLLRTLERQLDVSGIDRDFRHRHQDLRKDLRKLIHLLENPIFKHNLTVQESIRSLKEQIRMADETSPVIGIRKNTTTDVKASQSGNYAKHKEPPDREILHVDLQISDESRDPGWTLIDREKSVFVADILPHGFIARDGRIEAGDELLVVDGRPVAGGGLSSERVKELLDSKIGLLCSPSVRASGEQLVDERLGDLRAGDYNDNLIGRRKSKVKIIEAGEEAAAGAQQLELVVAKRHYANRRFSSDHQQSISDQQVSTSWRSDLVSVGDNNMVLHGDWTQIQVVELENDGSGLGFGIVGGRSTGVVVKTILAGGAADRDGRLRAHDHLLQINDVHLHGMSSEQVAVILRQQDQSMVKIVVGRPADATSPHPSHSSYQDPEGEGKQMDNRGVFTVPTKVASDPLLLDQHLQQMADAWAAQEKEQQQQQKNQEAEEQANVGEARADAATGASSSTQVQTTMPLSNEDIALLSSNTFSKENRRPDEFELIEVTLKRDPKTGLGIAVACYVHRKEEIGGLFVRNLLPGSVSDVDGRVRRHDQIVKVNNNDVDEVRSHKEAIKYLAESGDVVKLTLIRYHQSSIKYRFLEMLASQDSDRQVVDLHTTGSVPTKNMVTAAADLDHEEVTRKKWLSVLGNENDVLICKIKRSALTDGGSGQQHFGIALEGTVDVVNGTELRPHHYIRAVSPDSAAAASGRLRAGDELLEANGQELYGRSYLEVVDILRQLSSSDVQLVCARPKEVTSTSEPSTSGFEVELTRQTRTVQPPSSLIADRLVKAKSEVSLLPSGAAGASSSCDSLTTDRLLSEVANVLRSRSLEPLTNLAVWSTHPTHIELTKGDRGLGFSVLDYQDPLHPSDTVIVVRSLVPGGVAAVDGRVVPGDRLLYVNDVELSSHATLEKAVDALKSAPRGVVRFGIAKPLPLLDEHVHSPIITQTERLLAKGSMSSPQPNRKWSGERQTNRAANNVNGGQRYQQQYRSDDVYAGDEIGGPPPPLPRLPPPDWTLEARRRLYPEAYAQYDQHRQRQFQKQQQLNQLQKRQPPYAVRHTASASAVYGYGGGGEVGTAVGGRLPQSLTTSTLISGSYLSMSSWSGGSSPSLSPAASPSLLRGSWAADVIHLPSHLEQAIKIKKASPDPLGVTVEAVDKAINGCLVKSMLRSGAFGKDGRVHVGDFLVRMNNENLRNVTNSQARAILKRTNLVGATDLNVNYIPGMDADKYRDYVAKQLPPESPIPNVNRLSPKSPYVPRRQGAQSTGESDASSDAEMSYRDGEIPPMSPAASSQCGGGGGGSQQPTLDTDSLRRPSPFSHQPQQHFHHHDAASTTSSAAFVSATTTASVSTPIDYAHYPVCGDQYLASHYESAFSPPPTPPTQPPPPTSTSHEFRPHAFAEALPTVAEVSESKLSPDKEAESIPSDESEPKATTPTPTPTPPETVLAEIAPAVFVAEETEETKLVSATEPVDEAITTPATTTSVIVTEPASAPASPLVVETTHPQPPPTSKQLDSPTTSATSSLTTRSKYWGEPRTVELVREPGRSLGISIVGGRVEVSKGAPGTGTTVSGIFIKSVIAQSPAGRCGQLNMGDRILSVNGVDLKEATHEQAVEVIRNAANPVRFIVQSLHSIPVQAPGSGPSSPFAKQPVSPLSSLDSNEYQQRKPQLEHADGQRPTAPAAAAAAPSENIFSFDPSSGVVASAEAAPTVELAAESEEQEETIVVISQTETSPESGAPVVVEASVVVVEPTDVLSIVSEEHTITEEDDEVEKSERFDTFAADRPLFGTGHGALGRRPSEPLKGPAPAAAAHNADRRYSAVDRSSTSPSAPLKPFYPHKKPGPGGEVEGGFHRGRVDSQSAAAARKADDDSEPEDEFGYTEKKMKSKYGDLKGDLMLAEFEKGINGLGLSLAGHRDRSKLSVFVVGIQPESPAAVGNKVAIGDELLEINGIILHGRSHLNASAIIKGVQDSKVKLIVLRRPDAIDDMAVNPIQYNPSMQRWLSYSGVSSPSLRSASPKTSVAGGVSPKPSVAGVSPKASVTGAMSVDLSYAMNDKRKEGAERTLSIAGSHGKQSTAGGLATGEPTSPNFVTPRQVKVHKGSSGFGITLTDGTTNDNIRGIFITHISPDSPTAQDKALKIGDQVLAVNGRSVNDLTSSKVAEMIQDNSEVELTVSSHTIVPLPHSPASAAKRSANLGATEPSSITRKISGSISPNLACNQIVPGYETVIEIEKAGKGLGLSIVGGTDTVLGSVVIHEVYPDGAAAKDSRLQPGDQLLEVNGQSLREVAHETAISILRQTPSKVRLLIYRDPNLQLSLLDPTQIYNIFEVELLKKPGKGLGLSIVGRKTEPGVFISEVVKGGVADADGRLMQGDQILAVNGQDLTNAMQEQAATILKTCMGKVMLKVGRWKLTSGNNPNPSFPVSKILAPSGAISPTVPAISVHQAKATLVTIEEPPSSGTSPKHASPRPSPSPPPPMSSQQQPPFDVQVSTTTAGGSLTNGGHCAAVLAPTTAAAAGSTTPTVTRATPAGSPLRDGRITPEPTPLRTETTPSEEISGPSSTPTPSGSPSAKASTSQALGAEEIKVLVSVPTLELSEEGCDTVVVEMQKLPDRPLGMGIGKRPRGILVTSIQPSTPAAEKLRVGDRILAVNGQVVTDQQSAVNYVKSSGPRLVLQLARPRADCMDLATGHIRTSLTTIKEVTLQRGPEGGFGFSIDGGAEEKASTGGGSSSSASGDRPGRSPIYICSITKNGPAAVDGRVKIGDLILAVNGRSMQNAAHADAVQLIKQSTPKVTLMLIANPKHKRRNS